MSHVSVLLAGGGTGGHIFPALAVAERLTALQPGVSCRFLCSNRPLDAEILSKETLRGAPVSFRALSAAPFGLRPRTLLRFVSHWGESVRHAREEIRALRSAGKSVVIAAFGGFVAAPVVQAARVEKAPVVMANLDAVPGKANRWIARHAGDILTTTPIDRFPWPVCGPIVRSAALAPADPAECRRRLGLTDSLPTLVICGGSQGAGSLNRMLLDMLRNDPGVLQGWQVVHQTGKADAEACRAAYASANIPSLVEPFFREVGLLWGAAELAVCRAARATSPRCGPTGFRPSSCPTRTTRTTTSGPTRCPSSEPARHASRKSPGRYQVACPRPSPRSARCSPNPQNASACVKNSAAWAPRTARARWRNCSLRAVGAALDVRDIRAAASRGDCTVFTLFAGAFPRESIP